MLPVFVAVVRQLNSYKRDLINLVALHQLRSQLNHYCMIMETCDKKYQLVLRLLHTRSTAGCQDLSERVAVSGWCV